MMNDIFSDLIKRNKIIVYLDDIMIFSDNMDDHRAMVREVLRILRANNLFLRPEKCEFECDQVKYLGLIISEGKIEMDLSKLTESASGQNQGANRTYNSFWDSSISTDVSSKTSLILQGHSTNLPEMRPGFGKTINTTLSFNSRRL